VECTKAIANIELHSIEMGRYHLQGVFYRTNLRKYNIERKERLRCTVGKQRDGQIPDKDTFESSMTAWTLHHN